MKKPEPGTYPPYYQTYIDKVPGEDMLLQLTAGHENTRLFFEAVPKEKEDYRYAEGKWSVKEVFGHIIDSERVFSYRAMCIARGETYPLPGYDENLYAVNGNFSDRPMRNLIEEYSHLRRANIALFGTFDDEQASRMGTANGKPIQVSAIVAIIAGHELHHLGVLEERYLSEKPVEIKE